MIFVGFLIADICPHSMCTSFEGACWDTRFKNLLDHLGKLFANGIWRLPLGQALLDLFFDKKLTSLRMSHNRTGPSVSQLHTLLPGIFRVNRSSEFGIT